MSIVVFGPQGCGKTLAAPVLRAHFKLNHVWDAGTWRIAPPERPLYSTERRTFSLSDQIELDGLYPWISRNPVRFKLLGALFLTCEGPPPGLVDSRRVLSFERALPMAVEGALRTYLADWPRAQSIRSIAASTALEAIGVPPALHSKPLYQLVNTVMARLGWTRIRIRQPGHVATWAYQPPASKAAA